MGIKPPLERYQEKPFNGSSHVWAIDRLSQLPRDTTLLDIGAGSGIMGRKGEEFGFPRRVAIEIDEGAQRHIAPFYSKVVSELEELSGERFDVVLLLDVLEHLPDPFSFLKSVENFVKPQGTILVSVPNIAHWSVRFPLLFGWFEYTDRGILDRTHLQFFTRRRFRELLKNCSQCSLVSESSSIEPIEFLLPTRIWENSLFQALSRVRVALAECLPGLLAYQHLGVLRKQEKD